MITEERPHQRELKANPHSVLMSLAVISSRWEKTAAIEVYVEPELAGARTKLRSERCFVVLAEGLVMDAKVPPGPYHRASQGRHP
jgi:hypothetical protein